MFKNSILLILISICFQVLFVHCKSPSIIGVHPLDENYFSSEIIKCKDGSKSFTRDRLNDNFCDCIDGTDEPGTSACPAGKFYCRNVGSIPQFIFSSRVNDHFCDCCDGSDEYDGSFRCPNTCVMGGNIEYKHSTYISTDAKESKDQANLEDLIQRLEGLKIVLLLQVGAVLISFVMIFRIICYRVRSRRRRYSRGSSSTVTSLICGFF